MDHFYFFYYFSYFTISFSVRLSIVTKLLKLAIFDIPKGGYFIMFYHVFYHVFPFLLLVVPMYVIT